MLKDLINGKLLYIKLPSDYDKSKEEKIWNVNKIEELED